MSSTTTIDFEKIPHETRQRIPVFQVNNTVDNNELEIIKEEIKSQIKNGLVVIDKKVKFLGFVHQSL